MLYHQNENIIKIKDTRSAAIFMRRDFFVKSGGFDEFLFDFAKTGEDQEYFFRTYNKKMSLWSNTHIAIYHDEKIIGGCDLRTSVYRITRQKCVRSWVYCRLIHSRTIGNLGILDYIALCKSSFLNKQVLSSDIGNIFWQIKNLIQAIKQTKAYLRLKLDYYKIKNYSFLDPEII
ncbi:MAG: hypothetical protein HC905_12140 [Bacteroidales bacterium]|nr:hypothetical protein [Bacteroidales bacterium]